MRWQGKRESDNIEDRRAQNPTERGTGIRLPRSKAGMVLLVVVVVAGYYGYDLTPLLNGGQSINSQTVPLDTEQDRMAAKFTSVVLASTEDVWRDLFKQMGKQYVAPKLVMYRGATDTRCGTGKSVMGPFYCPTDQTVYIDLSFYSEMQNQLKAGGDFAQAYVIAHEVGHHIQKLLGIEQQVRRQMQQANKTGANQLSVKLELQADCFAGVWGKHVEQENWLEKGDLQQALQAAEAIGDDRLQQQSQGKVIPDSFTHGSSQQRYAWFKQGYDSGLPAQCNTFAK